jgi:transposase
MRGHHLVMSVKERRRKVEFEGVREGRMTIKEAAAKLDLSYRHCRRVYKRFCLEGDAGLVHRRRGRRSNRAKPEAFKREVIELCRERYEGFGPVLMMDKLIEDGYTVNRETLRLWLLEEDLWQPKRKRARHRQRRDRKEHFGELVQMDGSHHKWFGEDAPSCCLMNMVDDATGTTLALLGEQETTELAMRTLWLWCKRYGVPKALYTDRKNVFVTDREPTVEEQLAGEEALTEFGKACKKLGIEIIPASSPQAKGRVERNHGVYQDRFVKELRLKGSATIAEANKLLRNGFVKALNRKFAKAARSSADFHRTLDAGCKVREIFCFEKTATVANDWTLRCENRFYQILKKNSPLPRPRQKVMVRRLLNGKVQLLYQGQKIAFRKIAPPAEPLKYNEPPKPRSADKQKTSGSAPRYFWRRRHPSAACRL